MANTILSHSKQLVAYTLLVSIFSLFMCNGDGSSNITTGFSIDIFHRDSPLSPTYDPSLHPTQRDVNAAKRSIERARLINNHLLRETPFTFIFLTEGVYLTSVQLGTPPKTILSLVDTGSSLIWTQCKGCNKCFHQDQPYFDPQQSSTYTRVTCSSLTCKYTHGSYCDRICKYKLGYEDESYSRGDIVRDTVTLHSTDRRLESFPSVDFGCGYDSGGLFTGHESGILGIGHGYSSLIRQLDFAIKGKFSYCLVSVRALRRSSRLNFGDLAIVSGPGTVSTPLFYLEDEFYAVMLDAVSIGQIRVVNTDTLNNSKVPNSGNMIIDNGSEDTSLNTIVYHTLVNALNNYLRLTLVDDPENQYDICYYARKGVILLDITFHFRGANVAVRSENIFVRRSDDVVCFAVQPTDGFSLLGSNAQVNFLVGFDTKANRLSFRRFNCETYVGTAVPRIQI